MLAVATIVCGATYQVLVRRTAIGELLNGRRYTNGRQPAVILNS